jgi:hypothetical protein
MVRIESRVLECPAHDWSDARHVGPSGQLGNDPAEGAMLIDGRFDYRGDDAKVPVDDGGGRFVTTCFDSKDEGHVSSLRQ